MEMALSDSEMSEEETEREFFDVMKFHLKNNAEFQTIARAYAVIDRESTLAEKKRMERDKYGRSKSYISHPRAIAFALAFLGYRDCVLIVTALLHDLLEDFPEEWSFERLAHEFGQEVAVDVQSLTRPYADGRLKNATRRAKIIKILDRLHNMKTYHLYNDKKRQQKIKETIDELIPIATEVGFSDELEFFLKQWLNVEWLKKS